MNRVFLLSAVWLLALLFSVGGAAQSYERLWKNVEESRKKDLPQTLISQVNQIYEKARKEKNTPQLLKAYLSRVECQVKLTPDSLQKELQYMKDWAMKENDPVRKAVLMFLTGYYQLEAAPEKMDSVRYYFEQSVKDKEALVAVSAADFRPMVETGEWSQRYFEDTLYDLLLRQAIYQWKMKGRGSKAVQCAVYE